MQYCPKCASERIVKNGRHLERQRFRCKDCGFQFTRDTPRGRPATEKGGLRPPLKHPGRERLDSVVKLCLPTKICI